MGVPLWPHNAKPGDIGATFQTGKHKLAMLKFNKLANAYWMAWLSRFEQNEKLDALKAALPEYEAFITECQNGKEWLSGGDEPMMIDCHCFSVWEKIVMTEGTNWNAAFEYLDIKNAAPKMYAYVHKFRAHPKLAPHCMT